VNFVTYALSTNSFVLLIYLKLLQLYLEDQCYKIKRKLKFFLLTIAKRLYSLQQTCQVKIKSTFKYTFFWLFAKEITLKVNKPIVRNVHRTRRSCPKAVNFVESKLEGGEQVDWASPGSEKARLERQVRLHRAWATQKASAYPFTTAFIKSVAKTVSALFILVQAWPCTLKWRTTYLPYIKKLALAVTLPVFKIFKGVHGEGSLYLRGLFLAFLIDASITDDEPLWEPIEWSLVQSWILFIFLFAWIAENLISSRFGSYTGRDKRVWFAWYKTFWLVEGWYVLSLGAASLWVMVPHYYEITYTLSFVVSWWDWYARIFFFKFVCLYTIVLHIAQHLHTSIRWSNWRRSLALIILVNIFLAYLLYSQFFLTFFGYLTDPLWYQKNQVNDYIQLSHEPNKWAWGNKKRDHFLFHQSKQVFWFKNDGPFASAFLFYNLFFFLALFTLFIYWATLARRVYTTKEVTFTFTTYCVSSLHQFFFFFSMFFITIFVSYALYYLRMPNELWWSLETSNTLPLTLELSLVVLDVILWLTENTMDNQFWLLWAGEVVFGSQFVDNVLLTVLLTVAPATLPAMEEMSQPCLYFIDNVVDIVWYMCMFKPTRWEEYPELRTIVYFLVNLREVLYDLDLYFHRILYWIMSVMWSLAQFSLEFANMWLDRFLTTLTYLLP
jgi:hypothetical protein